MGIKETPTNFRVYYKSMIANTTQKKEEAVKIIEDLQDRIKVMHKEVMSNLDMYKNNFKVNLMKYEDFVNNKYSDGVFFKVARGLFINRNNNYELVSDLFTLFNLARLQKQLYDVEKDVTLYNKLLKLSITEYTEYLRLYYTEVHKRLILEGEGYAFGNDIGWICINRCILVKPRPHIDYAATKKREAELKAAGKRIYNKEEEAWCKRNGIEYKAEDKRVFKTNEYCYEIPLISCKLPNGTKYKLTVTDYRHTSVRGKTNEQLIKECKGDTKAICNLPIDMKTKLTLCDTADKILYTKFIRNENQQSIATPKAHRKNR